MFEWDEWAANDLFDVRLAIEPMAAAHAARQVARGASIDGGNAAIAASHAAIDRGDPYEIAGASTLIRERVAVFSGNELLPDASRQRSNHVGRLPDVPARSEPRLPTAPRPSNTIASGNEELARGVAFAHIEAGRAPSLEAISRLAH